MYEPPKLGSSRLIIFPSGETIRKSFHWLWNDRDLCEDEWCLSELVSPPQVKTKWWKDWETEYSWTGKKRSPSLGVPTLEHSYGACLHFRYDVETKNRRYVHDCGINIHSRIAEDHQKRYGIKDILAK